MQRVLFFLAAMQAKVFSIEKIHQHILFCSEIPIATVIKHPRALICVDNRISRTQLGNYLFSDSKVSGTITRKTGSLLVQVQCIWFAYRLQQAH